MLKLKPLEVKCKRHIKGNCYAVVAEALHTETKEALVIYTDGEKWWARPKEMFEDGRFNHCPQEGA